MHYVVYEYTSTRSASILALWWLGFLSILYFIVYRIYRYGMRIYTVYSRKYSKGLGCISILVCTVLVYYAHERSVIVIREQKFYIHNIVSYIWNVLIRMAIYFDGPISAVRRIADFWSRSPKHGSYIILCISM